VCGSWCGCGGERGITRDEEGLFDAADKSESPRLLLRYCT
jgi:hypothetical protein